MKKLGRQVPQDVEMEEAVLGEILVDANAMHIIAPRLKPQDFYNDKNRYIYEAMYQMYEEKIPIDQLTVSRHLRKTKMLELAGGGSNIMRLTSFVNSAANIEKHARILQELSIKRLLIRLGQQIDIEAYEDSNDCFDLLNDYQKILTNIEAKTYTENFVKADQLFKNTMVVLEERARNQKSGVTGIPSGFTALDRLTAGFHPEVTIVAARPAMGKSAFVSSLLNNICVKYKRTAGLFSLEMDSISVFTRMISSQANLKRGIITEQDFKNIYTKCYELANSNLYMDDFPTMNPAEFRSKARKMVHDKGVEIIMLDYIQLMDGDKTNINRAEEVSKISRTVKAVQKELKIPIISLAQISRANTQRGDKRPQLSELRESGSLEQDADNVIFIHRPEYYGEKQDNLGNSTAGLAQLIIAKQRTGSMGDVDLVFRGEYTEFDNASNFDIDLKGIDVSMGDPENESPF
jgi:replicative DNA helicase